MATESGSIRFINSFNCGLIIGQNLEKLKYLQRYFTLAAGVWHNKTTTFDAQASKAFGRRKGIDPMRSFFYTITLSFILLTVPLYVCCSPPPFQNEEQAMAQLRQATKKGDLPPESLPLQIEKAYPNTRTAALARLVRARI